MKKKTVERIYHTTIEGYIYIYRAELYISFYISRKQHENTNNKILKCRHSNEEKQKRKNKYYLIEKL